MVGGETRLQRDTWLRFTEKNQRIYIYIYIYIYISDDCAFNILLFCVRDILFLVI